MRKNAADLSISQERISLSVFLESYNKNMPTAFPRATVILLKKFQEAHAMLFKRDNLWSLGEHRKKLMDWLPRNSKDVI